MKGRSLFDVEIGDRVLWVVRGDRCLLWGIGDRVCGGEEEAIAI
ncbi:MAG: hypothetical protein WCP16_24625 [Pseudanabaena sp. ELA645]